MAGSGGNGLQWLAMGLCHRNVTADDLQCQVTLNCRLTRRSRFANKGVFRCLANRCRYQGFCCIFYNPSSRYEVYL
jgi:hypothetical protein